MSVIGHQTGCTDTSFTIAVTQDALGVGDYDAFYASSFQRLLGEPSQADVDSGRVKKVVISNAVTSVTFTGLNPNELHWTCAYRHSGGTATRWGFASDDLAISEKYTRPTVWQPIARNTVFIEDWSKGWANWIGEVGGQRGETVAEIWDDFVPGERWSVYPVSDSYREADATGGPGGGVPCSRQGWSTDEPLTIEFDFAHYSDPQWWDYYSDPWDALNPEYSFYRTIVCTMSGESSYSLLNSNFAGADYHDAIPDYWHAYGYIAPPTRNPAGAVSVYDEPRMIHHVKITLDGRTPSFPVFEIDGHVGNLDWWNGMGYMAGAYGAPQHFWTGSYYLMRGPMKFTGKPLYASFTDHLGWGAWTGNFSVGMGGENLGYQHGVFPRVTAKPAGAFITTYDGVSRNITQSAWSARSPIFPADEEMPWQKLRYGGASVPSSTVSVKVYRASDNQVLATSTPIATYGQHEIDLTPFVGTDLYVQIEGVNSVGAISNRSQMSEATAIGHVGYLYIETEVPEPPTLFDFVFDVPMPGAVGLGYNAMSGSGLAASMNPATGSGYMVHSGSGNAGNANPASGTGYTASSGSGTAALVAAAMAFFDFVLDAFVPPPTAKKIKKRFGSALNKFNGRFN